MNPEILCRYLEDTATDDEMRRVLDWLDADPEHRRELDNLDRVFCASAVYGPAVLPQRKSLLRVVLRRVARYGLEAAAVLLVGLGAGRLFLENRVAEWSQRMTSLEVPAGQSLSLKLEDGSMVWLNSGSRLEYPLVFARGVRRVKIDGEAFFEVAHDPRHPFVVETFACDVEVLGTRFDVTAREAEGDFAASLLEGSVKVTNRLSDGECCVLRPRESVTLVGGHLRREPLEDPDEFLWTRGLIGIKGLEFPELMARFEKCFGVRIVIARDRMPDIDYNHGKIRISDGIDSALRLLQASSDFTYEKNQESGVITIR